MASSLQSNDTSRDQLSDGYTDLCPLKQCARTATYNFYNSKYENFVKYIGEIATENDDIKKWHNELQKTDFDMFVFMGLDHLKESASTDDIIVEFCRNYDFDISVLKSDQIDKLKRYIALFKNM